MDISDLIPKPRGKGGLGSAATREALPESVATARPNRASPGSAGGSIASPLTEQAPPDDATLYTLTSSDGYFVLEFHSKTLYLDAYESEVEVIHRDPQA